MDLGNLRGRYEKIRFKNRKIFIYSSKELRNPNVYLIQDGQDLKEVENNIIGKIDNNSDDIVVVFIESLDRNSEYTPWYSSTLVQSIECFPGEGDFYLDFIVGELIPFLGFKLGIDILNERIYMGGSSLGGLISTYALFKYPDIFHGGIFVSSSYWYDGFLEYIRSFEGFKTRKIVYLDVGSGERPGKITLNKDVVEETKKVYEILLAKSIGERDILFKIHKGMTHEISYFIDRIYDGIFYMETKK